MVKQIESKVVGRLKQIDNFSDCWKSEEIEVPFFENKRLAITFLSYEPEHDKAFVDDADLALTNFFQLTTQDRISISKLVYKNYNDYLNEVDINVVDESLRQIEDIQEIWRFIYPTDIFAERRAYSEKDIYIMVACECEWEQEHGLQLVFRQGKKLTRVSIQDGHLTEADAEDKPDEQDELLSGFNE